MNFRDIEHWAKWVPVFWSAGSGRDLCICRFTAFRAAAGRERYHLYWYIGETNNSIRTRYSQETETGNTGWNTQNTNIRTTHVFRELRQSGAAVACYFVKGQKVRLHSEFSETFARKLQTWDKRTFVQMHDYSRVHLEKFLLGTYADEHLELPPLNHRF